jgi:hypothetical protein
MIVPLILDPLLKLIDREWNSCVKENARKKLFFEEVIQPLEDGSKICMQPTLPRSSKLGRCY